MGFFKKFFCAFLCSHVSFVVIMVIIGLAAGIMFGPVFTPLITYMQLYRENEGGQRKFWEERGFEVTFLTLNGLAMLYYVAQMFRINKSQWVNSSTGKIMLGLFFIISNRDFALILDRQHSSSFESALDIIVIIFSLLRIALALFLYAIILWGFYKNARKGIKWCNCLLLFGCVMVAMAVVIISSSFFSAFFKFIPQNLPLIILQNLIWIVLISQTLIIKERFQDTLKGRIIEGFIFKLIISFDLCLSINYHYIFVRTQPLHISLQILLPLFFILIQIITLLVSLYLQTKHTYPFLPYELKKYKKWICKLIQEEGKRDYTSQINIPSSCDYCMNDLLEPCLEYERDLEIFWSGGSKKFGSQISKNIRAGEEVYIKTDCSHYLHPECFLKAFYSSRLCPICDTKFKFE